MLCVFLANQLPFVLVQPGNDKKGSCMCSDSICRCDHSNGSQQCHANQSLSTTEMCYTAPDHHKPAAHKFLLPIKPFLYSTFDVALAINEKRALYFYPFNSYVDLILPALDKPPESNTSI